MKQIYSFRNDTENRSARVFLSKRLELENQSQPNDLASIALPFRCNKTLTQPQMQGFCETPCSTNCKSSKNTLSSPKQKNWIVLKPILQTLILIFIYFPLYAQKKDKTRRSELKEYRKDSIAKMAKQWHRFDIDLGGFIANYNSGVTFGSEELGVGIVVDAENLLGLELSTWNVRGAVNYRFGKTRRHSANFSFMDIRRRSNKVLGSEVNLFDYTIPVNTSLYTQFDFGLYRFKYDYAFYQDRRVSLAGSFGAFVMPIKFSVRAFDAINETAEVFAPLPILGLRSEFKISKSFFIKQSIDCLYLKIDNMTGSILDFMFQLGYEPIEHLGVGLSFNSNNLRLFANNTNYPGMRFFGDIKIGYSGVLLYLSYWY